MLVNFELTEDEKKELETMFISPLDSVPLVFYHQHHPEKRNRYIKKVAESHEASFKLIIDYKSRIKFTEEERDFLFQTILNDSFHSYYGGWIDFCSPTQKEMLLLAKEMAKNPEEACKFLSMHTQVDPDVKNILIESALNNSHDSAIVLVDTYNLSDIQREKLFNKMIENINSISSAFPLGYNYRCKISIFRDYEWEIIINKIVEQNNHKIAGLIDQIFPDLNKSLLNKIEHLVLINKLIEGK